MNKKNVTIYKEAAQQTAEWIHTIRTGVSVLCSLSDRSAHVTGNINTRLVIKQQI